jgi:hypothetical protein
MLSIAQLPPVVDSHLDPRLRALLDTAPAGLHVIFVG